MRCMHATRPKNCMNWGGGVAYSSIRRCIRAGFYTPDPDYDFEELCYEADQRLFNTILHSLFHVLQQLLPPALPQS